MNKKRVNKHYLIIGGIFTLVLVMLIYLVLFLTRNKLGDTPPNLSVKTQPLLLTTSEPGQKNNLPPGITWRSGIAFTKPVNWFATDIECGTKFTPSFKNNIPSAITICLPDSAKDITTAIAEHPLNKSSLVTKKDITLNNTPATYILTQDKSGSMSANYYVDTLIVKFNKNEPSSLKHAVTTISFTADKNGYRQYKPVFDQFLASTYFANEDLINKLSAQLCEDGKAIFANQISQFQHAVFTKDTSQLNQLFSQWGASLKSFGKLPQLDSLSYSIDSYTTGKTAVYSPGMCAVGVLEKRKDKKNPTLTGTTRNFLFSNFFNKWVLEGYYLDKIDFKDRFSGFN